MSRRIAHRPRYRHTYQSARPLLRSRQNFLKTRWTYRRQNVLYEKRALGYSLSLIPVGYRFLHSMKAITSTYRGN
jgi:hypothetical protein